MRKLLSVVFCMGLVSLLSVSIGCGDKKDKTKSPTTPAIVVPSVKKPEVTLTIDPADAKAKPGEKVSFTLKLTREADADKEVTFAVKVDPEASGKASADKVKGDAKEGKLVIDISKDAKDGDVKVTVTASSEKSKDSEKTVTVTVKKEKVVDPVPEKEVSISPKKSTLKNLKQGEKGDSTYKVEFKGATEATVKQKADVKGLMITVPDKGKIAKSGDSVKIIIEAAADAKEGDYEVTIEAWVDGVSASSALTVTVEKKDKK